MSDEPTRKDARARWRAERTTFQRVYDIVTGLNDFVTAKEVGTRADCSTDGARTALTQLVEMGIAERRGERPVEYRRNESYLRWKRIESLARDHSPAELREELDALLAEDQSLQERFDTSSPDAVSPSVFESEDHKTIHERWDALSRWRSVRSDLEIVQRAIHRAESNNDGRTDATTSA